MGTSAEYIYLVVFLTHPSVRPCSISVDFLALVHNHNLAGAPAWCGGAQSLLLSRESLRSEASSTLPSDSATDTDLRDCEVSLHICGVMVVRARVLAIWQTRPADKRRGAPCTGTRGADRLLLKPLSKCAVIVERRIGKWGDLALTGQKALAIPTMYHACVLAKTS
jgi:hypothetical protein